MRLSNNYFISKKSDFPFETITLPASKSIANRALIIQALAGGQSALSNLSTARDTQTMIRLLNEDDNTLDVLDAGTTMRFLTAYLAISNQKKIITGTERMQQRPIKILVDALINIGANISYLNADGYPPLKINGFEKQLANAVSVQGNISSQYISALMMIAPTLPDGLNITLEGKIGSRPYIEMTLAVMRAFGNTKAHFTDNKICIEYEPYTNTQYHIEPDWSAASYWYSLVALSSSSKILIKYLRPNSIQGDSIIQKLMNDMGVKTTYTPEGAILEKSKAQGEVTVDFTDCPDLAQTVAVVCAANGIMGHFTGLESLRIKETDRIAALQNELSKIGARLEERSGQWVLFPTDQKEWGTTLFKTYEDHRMAMAFAPLCLKTDITIEEPMAVEKSYPSFWADFGKVGLI